MKEGPFFNFFLPYKNKVSAEYTVKTKGIKKGTVIRTNNICSILGYVAYPFNFHENTCK